MNNSTTIEYPFPLTLNLRNVKYLERFLGGYTEKALRYFIYKKNENITKKEKKQNRNGKIKSRTVYDTSKEYKKLLQIIHKRISLKVRYLKGISGGVRRKTIYDMAKPHCGKEAALIIDLKDFYPSITYKMVYEFFKRANCSNGVAEILTELVTYEGFLPQGFPTSTTIANIVAYDLDIRHLEIAKKYNLVRTRWIDDIAFSGRKTDVERASRDIIGAVKLAGFISNCEKMKYGRRSAKKEEMKLIVTGLKIDHKSPRVSPERIRNIDELLRNCETLGSLEAERIFKSENEDKTKNFRASLKGKVNFVKTYNKEKGLELERRVNAICW